MAGSLELIAFDQGRKQFVVKQDAVALLQKLSGPVAVVSVCGRARMGKSTLLNQLVTKLTGAQAKGFTVAATHKPCTKGLHVWSKPIQRTTADGKKMNVLLIDCEGIDAFDQTMDYSTQIFSLGVLLSSLLVFNQMGGIDESAIDKLSSVCEFAKLIQTKSTQGGGGPSAAADLSPFFLWLLRDFQFQLTEDGHTISTREYMEEVLRDMAGTTQAVKNRNQMRTSIKSLFPDRDCFSLVRPCLEESDLANMDKLKPEKLRPEFKQGLERLVDLIMSRAQPKQYRGQYVTGSALAAFAQAYVDVINKGQVPAISSTWQSVMQGENQRALESALAAYERGFANGWQQQQQQQQGGAGGGVGADGGAGGDLQDQLDAVHAAALQAATQEFDQQALGDASERRVFEAKLREQAGLRFAVVRQARLAEADRKVTDLLTAGATRLMQVFGGEPVDLTKVDAELAAVLQQYDVQACGPTKYKRVGEFLVNTVVRSLTDVAKRCQAAAAAANTKLQAARKEAAEAQGRATDLTHRAKALESAEATLKVQLQSAQSQLASLQGEASDKGRALAAAQARVDSLLADQREASARAERLEQRASAAEVRAAESAAAVAAARSDALRDASSSEARVRELAAAREELEVRRKKAEEAAAAAVDRARRLDGDVARLEAEAQAAGARRAALEQELASSRAEAGRQLQAREASIAQLQAEVRQLQQAASGRGEDRERALKLSQQVAEQETTIQRLQQERTFLQQQYDTLRRESMSPRAGAAAAAAWQQQQQQQQHGLSPAPAPAAAAAAPTPAAPEAMEVDAEPSRKRRRVPAPEAETVAVAAVAATTAATATPGPGGAGAGGGASPPFSNERRVEVRRRGTPGAGGSGAGAAASPATAAVAAAAGGQPSLPPNLSKMTVQEMKNWLTENGAEDRVFELNNRKPAPKKQEWVDLIKERCGA